MRKVFLSSAIIVLIYLLILSIFNSLFYMVFRHVGEIVLDFILFYVWYRLQKRHKLKELQSAFKNNSR